MKKLVDEIQDMIKEQDWDDTTFVNIVLAACYDEKYIARALKEYIKETIICNEEFHTY